MKTALITGASRGLGKALAEIFTQNNYNLILNCKESKLDAMTGIDIVKGDLRSDDTIAELTKLAEARDIDILINNAGVYLDKPFLESTKDDFRKMINVNLLAPVLLTKAIWPIFQKKQSGLIININSLAGKQGSEGESAYCASKFGLRGFSQSIQFDATSNNIKVMDIFLGSMNTDMTKNKEVKAAAKFIETTEVAKLIFCLCKNYRSLRITELDICRSNY